MAVNPPSRGPATSPRRETQRLETRERVFDAALAEITRVGLAAADVATIVTAAGVARGTFYFHFPTKEHVVAEAKQRIEAQLADELATSLPAVGDVRSGLEQVVALIEATERRVGSVLFRELLAHHFAAAGIASGTWSSHRVLTALAALIDRGRQRGEVDPEVDPVHGALFFLLGLYALFSTMQDVPQERAEVVDRYLASQLRALRRG